MHPIPAQCFQAHMTSSLFYLPLSLSLLSFFNTMNVAQNIFFMFFFLHCDYARVESRLYIKRVVWQGSVAYLCSPGPMFPDTLFPKKGPMFPAQSKYRLLWPRIGVACCCCSVCSPLFRHMPKFYSDNMGPILPQRIVYSQHAHAVIAILCQRNVHFFRQKITLSR